eukprot:5611144-Pyramimonas_sp.AAC.1
MNPRPRARGMRDCRDRIPFMYVARKLYEFPAVTKVYGLPPAPSWPTWPGRTMCQPGVGFWKIVRDLKICFENYHCSDV